MLGITGALSVISRQRARAPRPSAARVRNGSSVVVWVVISRVGRHWRPRGSPFSMALGIASDRNQPVGTKDYPTYNLGPCTAASGGEKSGAGDGNRTHEVFFVNQRLGSGGSAACDCRANFRGTWGNVRQHAATGL